MTSIIPSKPVTPPSVSKEESVDANKSDNSEYRNALTDVHRSWYFLATRFNYNITPDQFYFTKMPHVIQKGPNCGLVALSMVSLKGSRPASIEELFDISYKFGFTKRGEMFSAMNLYSVAHKALSADFDITLHTSGLMKRKKQFFEDLKQGAIYVVPYDADRDNTPALYQGHRAHWAVICGYIIDRGNYFILASQGKSKFVGIWPFEKLVKSNENLIEISPERLEGNIYQTYDIKRTLANHYIYFKLREQK